MSNSPSKSSFPNNCKLSLIQLLSSNSNLNDQVLAIYYNDYKLDPLFSFEHLCDIINDITIIPIDLLMKNYEKSGKWDLNIIPAFKLDFIISRMLNIDSASV